MDIDRYFCKLTRIDNDLLFLFVEVALGTPPALGFRGRLGHQKE
jgi:hypothetical protein